MSHYMTALAMKQSGLKPATKIVLYWLADCHNQETGQCFPSINHLASVCEMSRRSVEGHLSILEELGLIKRFNQFRDRGGKTSNSYVLELMGTSEHNSSTESDTQNLRMVCEKSAHGHTQDLRMNNLGRNNLGNEPCILFGSIEELEVDFEKFWAAYPRKVGKAQCRKVYVRSLAKIKADELLEKVDAFAASCQGKEVKFIPHPSTWLNQERWNDTLSTQTINVQNDVLKSMGLSYD
jgi:DNA-binding transcriptional ArsR family regulator